MSCHEHQIGRQQLVKRELDDVSGEAQSRIVPYGNVSGDGNGEWESKLGLPPVAWTPCSKLMASY